MNSLIQSIFTDFYVDGVSIPVKFLKYDGKLTTYVTYMETNIDSSYAGDNEILGYVSYYDFDIYSKGNYFNIVEAIKEKLKDNGFIWQPSRTSQDMYEADTGYYHKTLCFAIERQENEHLIPSV